MWPWSSRVQRAAREDPGGPAVTPAPPASAEPAPIRAEGPAGWQTLPPIVPAIPYPPLVNPVQRFSAGLTSWQSPSYLGPLGHSIDPDGPSGVIPATPVTPVQRQTALPTGGSDMPLAIPPASDANQPRRGGAFTMLQRIFGNGDDSPAPSPQHAPGTPAELVLSAPAAVQRAAESSSPAPTTTSTAPAAAPTIGAAPAVPVLEQPAAPVAEPATRTGQTDLVLAAPVQRSTPLTTSTYTAPIRTLTPLPADTPPVVSVSRAAADLPLLDAPQAGADEAGDDSGDAPTSALAALPTAQRAIDSSAAATETSASTVDSSAPTLGAGSEPADVPDAPKPATTDGPASAMPVVPAVQRAVDNDPPRLGLGAPLFPSSSGAQVQRSAASSPPPRRLGLGAPLNAPPVDGGQAPPPALDMPVVSRAADDSTPLIPPAVQRLLSGEISTSDASDAASSSAESEAVSAGPDVPAAAVADLPVAPTLSSSQLTDPAPTASPAPSPVQRAATGVDMPVRATPSTVDSGSGARGGPDPFAGLPVLPVVQTSSADAPARTPASATTTSPATATTPAEAMAGTLGADPIGPATDGASPDTSSEADGPLGGFGQADSSAGLEAAPMPMVQLIADRSPMPILPAAAGAASSGASGPHAVPSTNSWSTAAPQVYVSRSASDRPAGPNGTFGASSALNGTFGPPSGGGTATSTYAPAPGLDVYAPAQRAVAVDSPATGPALGAATASSAFDTAFGGPAAPSQPASHRATFGDAAPMPVQTSAANGTSVQLAHASLPVPPAPQRSVQRIPSGAANLASSGGGGLVLPPTQQQLTAEAVQRMAAPTMIAVQTEPITVQAADAADPPGAAAPESTPAAPADAAAAGAAPAGGAAQAPEELLKTLFDPLLRRIKAELRNDRERRGLITDYRR